MTSKYNLKRLFKAEAMEGRKVNRKKLDLPLIIDRNMKNFEHIHKK